MKFSKTEWHQVAAHFQCDLPDEEVIELFGSVQRLKEIISHQEQSMRSIIKPTGEPPTEKEDDLLNEVTQDCYKRVDDWFQVSKGGFDVTFSYED